MASSRDQGETLTSVHSTLRESFLASDVADNHHQIPRSLAGLTLAAVLNHERKSTPGGNAVVRTLLDIIQTDETLASNPTRSHFTGKKTWKSFKERLKLRRHNSNPTASHHDPQPQSVSRNSLRDSLRRASSFGAAPSDEMTPGENGDQRRSISMRLSVALAAEREQQSRTRLSTELERNQEDQDHDQDQLPSVSGVPPQEDEPTRMSLMDLLEETDRQSGTQGPIYSLDDADDEEEDKHQTEENKGSGVINGGVGEVSCCVCMVRHKGAAFIPCGHTFCRTCSRELWVQRGHCPLCNNFILEILDIF